MARRKSRELNAERREALTTPRLALEPLTVAHAAAMFPVLPCRSSSPIASTGWPNAGTSVSARDLKEFHLMGSEKTAAFHESWKAMPLQGIRANQALGFSLWRSFWSPSFGADASHAVARQLQSAALGILGKGMGPVHRVAVANAKRLSRGG